MRKLASVVSGLIIGIYLVNPFNLIYAQNETKITASDAGDNDRFGYSVSRCGDYIVVGAYNDSDNGDESGSAYIFKRNGTTWIEEIKLFADDGDQYDYFGFSVAICGNYAMIGAPGNNRMGAVYIFKRDGTSWNQKLKLTGPSFGTEFGESVSCDDNTLVIGARDDDINGEYSGSVYIYKLNGSIWNLEARLSPSDAAAYQFFGMYVCIKGDYVVACSIYPSSAYIFKRTGIAWTEEAKLGPGFDICSLSLNDKYVVFGSSGAALVFKHDGSSWIQDAKLTASDSTLGFGDAVSLWDDQIAVSAPYGKWNEDFMGSSGPGSVYLFDRDQTGWQETAKILPSDSKSGNLFGQSVHLKENYLVVGAPIDTNNGIRSGAVYVYDVAYSPFIVNVSDIPHDQGGYVTLKWKASSLDKDVASLPFYSIWRALPAGMSARASAASPKTITENFTGPAYRFASQNTGYVWEWLANQPAHRMPYYGYTAKTLYDSMSTTDATHYFMVSAHTNDPNIFYDSNVDSGYSVDNLPPLPPAGLVASVINDAVALNWNESLEPDLRFYIIYRNATPYDTTSQTQFVDADVEIGQTYSYKLTAVDIHENESEFSEEALSGPVPVELMSFTASVKFNTVTLNWQTATETANFGFSIERRTSNKNGINNNELWEKIGFVKGCGTTNTSRFYHYKDTIPPDQFSNAISYQYRLKQIDLDGAFTYSHIINVILEMPQECQLLQNYPNPFNSNTLIHYHLPAPSAVELTVCNVAGQIIRTLVRQQKSAGYHRIQWDGSDDRGMNVPSGLYFYRLKIKGFELSQKMLLLR
ncbi:T9SS type A sorting domain-containing protein [candidate division KSB1 bacterium]|nr:T9SS type A sorting domain-containing protein [candidate division KSB1 bacterium]